jgi:predicted  nucleic acid-binding Zn-ribbon protein
MSEDRESYEGQILSEQDQSLSDKERNQWGRCVTHHICQCLNEKMKRLEADNTTLRRQVEELQRERKELIKYFRDRCERVIEVRAERDSLRAELDDAQEEFRGVRRILLDVKTALLPLLEQVHKAELKKGSTVVFALRVEDVTALMQDLWLIVPTEAEMTSRNLALPRSPRA